MKTTAEMIVIMQADVAGKKIDQCDRRAILSWAPFTGYWDWVNCDYRIRPLDKWERLREEVKGMRPNGHVGVSASLILTIERVLGAMQRIEEEE